MAFNHGFTGFKAHLRGSSKSANGMAHFKLTTLSLDCVVTEYKITGFPRLTFEVAELVGVSEGSGERLLGSLPTRRGTISEDDLSVDVNELLELMGGKRSRFASTQPRMLC